MKQVEVGRKLGILVILALVALLASPVVSTVAQSTSEEDEANFAEVIGQLPSLTPLAGPASGQLDAANADSFAAGVSIADGVGHAEFTVPDVPAGTLWAFAMLFRQTDADQNFLLVFPDGTWSFEAGGTGSSQGGEGLTINSTPGAIVTLDVLFDGPAGSFGIDGAYVSSLDLTGLETAGDVAVTGYLGLGSGAALLDYSNFSVYELPGAEAPPPDASPSPVAEPATPVVESPVAADSAATFDQLRIEAITKPVVFGPENGALVHDAERVTFTDALINVSDFATRIECIAPRGAAEGLWDCGLAFRDVNSANHYRLGVISDGSWFLSLGSEEPSQLGDNVPVPANAGEKVAIDLIVIGDTGYFGVNGQFIAELDLSALPGPGSVAAVTGFFTDTYIEGGETAYEDFIVWSFDEGTVPPASPAVPPSPTPEPTETPLPTATASPVESPVTGEFLGVEGTTYTSPTYGYTLTWGDTWSVIESSSDDGFDFLQIDNGVVSSVLYASTTTITPNDCLQDTLEFYQGDPAYSNVAFETDDNGQELRTPGDDVATALLSFTYTQDGASTDYIDYVACIALPDQGAIVTLENYVTPDQFSAQRDAITALQNGLDVGGQVPPPPTVEPTVAPVETPAEPTEEPVTPSAIDTATTASFALSAINDSGITGVGTLEGEGRSVQLSAIVLGADRGSIVGIARGSCADIVDGIQPDYDVGEVDAGGILQEEVRVSLSVLLTRDTYSVVVYAPGEDQTAVLACGEIQAS